MNLNFTTYLPTAFDLTIIFIVSYFIYQTFKNTNIFQIFVAFIGLALLKKTANYFELKLTGQAIGFILDNALVVFLIIFQEDLKKFFLRINKTFSIPKNEKVFNTSSEQIVNACFYMAGKRTGAIIIFENEMPVAAHSTGSVPLNADISYELILSIFEKKSVLHDGAILVSGDKIISARNVVPLYFREDELFNYGTRHRAALGISEITDCLVLVISEERGEVRFAESGKLSDPMTKDKLKIILNEKLLINKKSSSNKLGLVADSISNLIKRFKK